jgi:hypothetical protein
MLKELSRRRVANTAPTWRTEVIRAINLSERVQTEFVPAGHNEACGELFYMLRHKVLHHDRARAFDAGSRVVSA